jgi:hypothetical protein
MNYRSLLFPGVLITAIASLLIVQSCTKNDQTESDRTGTKLDRAVTDAERERVGMLAIRSIYNCYNARLMTNCKPLEKYKSIIQDWCESRDRAACELLVAIQKSESEAIVLERMEGGPTRNPLPQYPG